MIEVKGMDYSGNFPMIVAFDGRVLEFFLKEKGRMTTKRFHLDHLKKLEIKERSGKGPIIHLEMNIPGAWGDFEFSSGGENLDELVDVVNAATNTF